MNQEQLTDIVRHLITTFGGVVAGWGAAKGWLSADQILAILNSQTFIGLVVGGIGMIWGLISRTKKNQVNAVAALPEVKAVVTEPTVAGATLATAAADNVVPAGSSQAAAAAER